MIGVISASDDKLKAAEVRRAVPGHLFGGQLALAHTLRYRPACRTWCCSIPAAKAADRSKRGR